ncbi:MAG: YdcF family protein [Mariprofundus sp.]
MGLILSSGIGQLILPPAGLLLLAFLGVLLWRRLLGRALVVVALAGLWLLAMEPVRDMLLNPLEQHYPAFDATTQAHIVNSRHTAIVLLGGGVYVHAPEYGGRDSLHDDALLRTLYAADLARQTGLDVYATGGTRDPALHEPEGQVMARMLVRFGVDAGRAHAENRARTTWENGEYTRAMMALAGIKQVILVTTAMHMSRSVWVFESLGINVIPAPCNYRESRQPYDALAYLPRWDVLSDSGDALHEYLGLLWYRLKHA